MKVRAKFVCCEISKRKWSKQDEGATNIVLQAVTTGSDENKEFWRYTPTGKVEMQINSEAAEKYFEAGEEYYLTFEKAEQ